ncbi:hypothetical protein C0992_005319, partial [Termitomyces sp. T32_za158]
TSTLTPDLDDDIDGATDVAAAMDPLPPSPFHSIDVPSDPLPPIPPLSPLPPHGNTPVTPNFAQEPVPPSPDGYGKRGPSTRRPPTKAGSLPDLPPRSLIRTTKGKQRLVIDSSASTHGFQTGSSATPLMADVDIARSSTYGIVLASPGEGAATARARHNANEARFTKHIADFDSRIAQQGSACQRNHDDMFKLVRASTDAIPEQVSDLVLANTPQHTAPNKDADFRALQRAVVEQRTLLKDLRVQVDDVRNSWLIHQELSHSDDIRTPMFSPLPLLRSPVHSPVPAEEVLPGSKRVATQQMSVAPPTKKARINEQSHPRPTSPQRTRDASPQRKPANAAQRDVLFGPVGNGNTMSPDEAKKIAMASVQLASEHLSSKVVYNALQSRDYPDHISIRFREWTVADHFIRCVQENPPEDGQTAFFARQTRQGDSQSTERDELMDIMRGRRASSSSAPRPIPLPKRRNPKW